MLAKFKRTTELDMKVFEADRILDYAELFISSGKKPTFKKGAALEDEEERDPFDDMMDEAQGEKKDSGDDQKQGGMLPESVQSTQERPDQPLQ